MATKVPGRGITDTGRRARILASSTLLVLALGAAACGGGSGSSSSSSSTTAVTSTSRSSTTTTAAPTTTTQPPTPTTPITIAHGQNATEPDGSGCSPTGDTLPDGVWFGTLVSVDVPGNSIGLDLECFYTGPAADAKAASQGQMTPVPNGYLITNQSTKVFTVPTWSNVQVLPLQMIGAGGFTGANQAASTGVSNANTILTMPAPKIVWVKVVGGKAIVIQSQFTP